MNAARGGLTPRILRLTLWYSTGFRPRGEMTYEEACERIEVTNAKFNAHMRREGRLMGDYVSRSLSSGRDAAVSTAQPRSSTRPRRVPFHAGRVVIECESVTWKDGGLRFRVWTEVDAHRVNEVVFSSFIEACAALMDQVEDGAAYTPEPGLGTTVA